jgi:tetratricopeptide (TPR) repeat protein
VTLPPVGVIKSTMFGRSKDKKEIDERRNLEHALSQDPKDHRAWLRLAEHFLRKDDRESAVAHYRSAAEALRERCDHAKAAAVLKRIVDLRPDDVATRESLGRTYESLDRKSDAAQTFAELARFHRAKGGLTEAIAFYRKSLALDPRREVAAELETLAPTPVTPPPKVVRASFVPKSILMASAKAEPLPQAKAVPTMKPIPMPAYDDFEGPTLT